MDAIKLMKYQGVKVGRIRVWVNPIDKNGDLDRAIKLAKRLKKADMQICIDFHFSDTWADPAHQITPAAWSTTSIDDLEDQVFEYTKQTLKKFKEAGCTPQWVQLGNEISNGMMWPLGQINSDNATQWQNLSRLHQAATNALRSVAPQAKSVLHLDCGGDYNRVKWWLEQADTYNLTEYDVVGISYYSQWHGDLADLKSVLDLITKERKQKVLIAETAYPWIDQTFGSDVIDVSYPAL
ncbi:MAG: glycosyl hydrolase 53 family protein, partial [Actinobacteria bacterium]|nr:glycosyl hydrolase 53 family protein [Actinomycetota bacterium]